MEYIYIGKFLGTHGLKGEIKFKSDFKYLDRVLKEGFYLYIDDDKKEELLSYRRHKDCYLVLLKGINDIDSVLKYVNKKVYINKEDLDLQSNEYVMEDFINKKVYFNDQLLGVIDSITNYGSSNYVMKIVGESELLIPYNNNFIDKVSDNVYLKNVEVFVDEN